MVLRCSIVNLHRFGELLFDHIFWLAYKHMQPHIHHLEKGYVAYGKIFSFFALHRRRVTLLQAIEMKQLKAMWWVRFLFAQIFKQEPLHGHKTREGFSFLWNYATIWNLNKWITKPWNTVTPFVHENTNELALCRQNMNTFCTQNVLCPRNRCCMQAFLLLCHDIETWIIPTTNSAFCPMHYVSQQCDFVTHN